MFRLLKNRLSRPARMNVIAVITKALKLSIQDHVAISAICAAATLKRAEERTHQRMP